jgi:hypothetical protein
VIGNGNEIETKCLVKLGAQKIARCPRAIRGVVKLTGIAFHPGDDLIQRLGGNGRIGDKNER